MRCKSLFASVMLAALGVASAEAQSPNTLRVTIPFAFTIDNSTLPAGDYSVSHSGFNGSRIMAMRSGDDRRTVLFVGSQTESSTVQNQSRLVFRRYGDDYVLTDIWWAGYPAGVKLPVSKTVAEPVNTAGLRPAEVMVILAR